MQRVCDAYACLGVMSIPCNDNALQVESHLVVVTNCASVGIIDAASLVRISEVELIPLGRRTLNADSTIEKS